MISTSGIIDKRPQSRLALWNPTCHIKSGIMDRLPSRSCFWSPCGLLQRLMGIPTPVEHSDPTARETA
eukprot:15473542-Alexandrium_andersonii.AAC.1